MAQNGDFLFLIDGMKQPSILRICEDHFDVIVLAVPPPALLAFHVKETHLSWVELLELKLHHRGRITMIWDWLPAACRKTGNHENLLSAAAVRKSSHLSPSERILAVARAIEGNIDFQSYNAFHRYLQEFHVRRLDSEVRLYIRLMQLAVFHHQEYLWLRHTVTRLRWILWAIQHDNEIGASENAVLAFWSSKDVVSCDLYELCKWIWTSACQTNDANAKTAGLIRMDFDEPEQNPLFAAILCNDPKRD